MTNDPITAGFLPLLDSAILVAARELGLTADEGIDLALVRETSWANIRDRMAVGHLDVAHMLAPMPIASNLGLSPLNLPLIAPFALGLGGNAVTVSLDLWQKMHDLGAGSINDPKTSGFALKKVIETGDRDTPLTLAVVHPHSGHNLELRYWLAGCGIDPENDLDIVVVPPPLMPDALASGHIDGFCVGEPWNSVAISRGVGHMATVKAAIWKSSPEKVLGVNAKWAEEHDDLLKRLVRALHRAAEWCGDVRNHHELAAMLSAPERLDGDPKLILNALTGAMNVGGGETETVQDFFVPFETAATFPWQSHALWFYSQMVRWGQIAHSPENAAAATASYRPDIYRAAIAPAGRPIPSANSKVEGGLNEPTPVGSTSGTLLLGPDGFFDGKIFDPARLDDYIQEQTAAVNSPEAQ